MGGSGGGTGSYLSPHDAELLAREARQRLLQSRVDSAVNARLQSELPDINDRDADLTNDRLEAIESSLSNMTGDVQRLLFGGSVSKHTYVEGLSDIDALVEVAEEGVSNRSPADVRDSLERALRESLPHGEVDDLRKGRIAVTVRYLDGTEIQLLPAIRQDNELAVSSWDGNGWTKIRPQDFGDLLTATNQNQGGAVVPAIKLAKSILANVLGDNAPTGYHVEALAIDAFRGYTGPRTSRATLIHLVESASERVLRPIRDISGQSTNVDDYLGEQNTSDRQRLARRLQRLANTMRTAQSVETWDQLLG